MSKIEPKPKYTIYAFIIIVALALWGCNFINWRDTLLLLLGPIVLWHFLLIYILSASKPVQNNTGLFPVLVLIKGVIRNLECLKRSLSLTGEQYKLFDKTINDMNEITHLIKNREQGTERQMK